MNTMNNILLGIFIAVLFFKGLEFYDNYSERKRLEKIKLKNELLKLELLKYECRIANQTRWNGLYIAITIALIEKYKISQSSKEKPQDNDSPNV